MQAAINTALLAGIFIGVWWTAINSTGSVLREFITEARAALIAQIAQIAQTKNGADGKSE